MRKLFVKAGWAPIALLILHAIIAKTSLRQTLDYPIHFLGGAAAAFFVLLAFECLPTLWGPMTPFARYLLSFTVACTAGLFWEFAEFVSDKFYHTHVQQSLPGTMADLIADATGAATLLFVMFVCRQFTRDRTIEQHQPSNELIP